MLQVTTDIDDLIVTLEPDGELRKEDFDNAVKIIDPVIQKYGKLNGLIIKSKHFPGWEDFAAFSRHMRFVKNHHQKIKQVALVTDSVLGDIAPNLASHFVEAKIKAFTYTELQDAKEWIVKALDSTQTV
jgi:hypothetical protein